MTLTAYNAVATAEVVETVQIVAPSTLAGGYTFETDVNGQTMTVQVPKEGVVEGQTFTATVVSVSPKSYALSDNAPTGKWRDGLCGCCKYGPLHPLFLMACCFPQILVSQVMTRMKLNYRGEPAAYDEWNKTFRNVWLISILYYVLNSLTTPDVKLDENGYPVPDTIDPTVGTVNNVISCIFALYVWYILYTTRVRIRERYNIPEERCAGCEDMVCTICCGCCTAAQMANHTADYDVIRATCCTKTGLPENVDPEAMYE